MTAAPKFNLDAIRSELIRQEETIIFALIERGIFSGLLLPALLYSKNLYLILAQFKQNLAIYKPGLYEKFQCSFLEYFLGEVERVHSATRLYHYGNNFAIVH